MLLLMLLFLILSMIIIATIGGDCLFATQHYIFVVVIFCLGNIATLSREIKRRGERRMEALKRERGGSGGEHGGLIEAIG